jgi:hypothetical protein
LCHLIARVPFTFDASHRPVRPELRRDRLDGDLVIEYEHRSSDDRWTVKARTRTTEFAAALSDMLAGVTPVETGSRCSIGDRVGRALVAPWKWPTGVQPYCANAVGAEGPDCAGHHESHYLVAVPKSLYQRGKGRLSVHGPLSFRICPIPARKKSHATFCLR